ncbi:transcriptional regulator [Actinomadura spongiicola]|uniref:Transcriptional regulator n=1 Tax=Actinomadura spongiicola TaxID=2303421 RepID=A0A372GCA3_9ACTN|nr:transcriptional regulator [Actinomadura spongiicola]
MEALSRKFATPVQGLTVRLLATSTLQGILTHQRKNLPRWSWVASYVIVLRAIASRNGVNPDTLGTLDEWKAAYDDASRQLRGLPPDAAGAEAEEDVAAVREARRARTRPARLPVAAGDRPRGRPGRDEALDALTRRFGTAGWWHPDYQDVVTPWVESYLELEQAARVIWCYEPQFVPGLLQTPAYARAVIAHEYGTSPETQIRRRVELRTRRQQRLWGPNPPRLWAILDETVLRRDHGGPETMRAQLDHLLEVSCRPNVRIQVMPLARGGYAAAGGPITALRFAAAELPDVIYLEHLGSADYLIDPEEKVCFGQVLDRLKIEAATPEQSRDMLRRLRTEH